MHISCVVPCFKSKDCWPLKKNCKQRHRLMFKETIGVGKSQCLFKLEVLLGRNWIKCLILWVWHYKCIIYFLCEFSKLVRLSISPRNKVLQLGCVAKDKKVKDKKAEAIFLVQYEHKIKSFEFQWQYWTLSAAVKVGMRISLFLEEKSWGMLDTHCSGVILGVMP